MNEPRRTALIDQTLQLHGTPEGSTESLSVPLSRGATVLPVISLPLSVPVLNAKSFRIAPQLQDHPQADLVRSDPTSPEAQALLSELVRNSHKYANELKESLKEGQDEPGVITRGGVLINANTRCVLMRELLAQGALRADAIRVAVLPANIDGAELFDLEAVLQKQRPHKDEYNLVSELMMLKTLNEDAGMTEQQIAKRQRLASASDVVVRFQILSLMERARTLVIPPLPISTFATQRSKLQNWKELLKRVDTLDNTEGAIAGHNQIREWLQAFLAGIDSVHRLRFANPGWVERYMVSALAENGDIGDAIARHATSGGASTPIHDPEGLDFLDFGETTTDDTGNEPVVQEILGLTVAARRAGAAGTVQLADGATFSAPDVLRILKVASDVGLKESKRGVEAGEQLVAPENLLRKTCDDFVAAIKAIDEACTRRDFDAHVGAVRSLLEDIAAYVEEATELIDGREGSIGTGGTSDA